MNSVGFFDRERTITPPGFSRWLVPPTALAVHLSIGQVYAFSVFNLPLTKAIGITKSSPNDWTQPELAWIFSFAIFFLGASAATFGRWVERLCWFGVSAYQLFKNVFPAWDEGPIGCAVRS